MFTIVFSAASLSLLFPRVHLKLRGGQRWDEERLRGAFGGEGAEVG